MGSSKNRMSVCWARTREIHTRWRCPPESESTVRSARSSTLVMRKAVMTSSLSSDDHCRYQAWWGCRPRATKSDTISPSGATGVCGKTPRLRARSRRRKARMGVPSSVTSPACVGSKLAIARSSVDLPQPFGPIIVVTCVSGIATSRESIIVFGP